MTLAPSPSAALTMSGVSKAFPGVKALDNVSLCVGPGEVHALLGENGAGKSTLLKILSGVYRADSGEVRLGDEIFTATSPKAARIAGIAMIHQELQQVPRLDVAQNMFLGDPLTHFGAFTDRRRMRARAREALASLDPTIDVAARLGTLRVAQRQIVEIAKALLAKASVIAMDEPTSSLTPHEFDRLAEVIEQLRAQGVAIIYVSHKLEEVYRVASRATILRDGKLIGAVDLAQVKEPHLVSMMVGRDLETHPQRSFSREDVVLEARGLSRDEVVRGVNISLRRGEVLGVAGLVGAGRTEMVRLLAGVDAPTSGEVFVRGKLRRFRSPREAIGAGIALLPEERKKDGILPQRSILSNVTLPRLPLLTRFGLLRRRRMREQVQTLARSVHLRPPDIDRAIRLFSGGNQQKAIICRWLMAEADVLIFDEPTRGIDVGAKSEIYRLIEGLAEQGRSMIVVSSELPEILRVSDRVLVMRRGIAEGVLERAEATEEAIMRLAITGAQKQSQSA